MTRQRTKMAQELEKLGQGTTTAQSTLKYPIAEPGRFRTPIKTKYVTDKPALTTGLHLMLGPRAAGKTIVSLSLAAELKDDVPVAYNYLLEPRANGTRELLSPETWTKWYTKSCEALSGGVLIIDSMTYVIAMLTQLYRLSEFLSDVTYTGGLSPRDIQGALIHDEIARDHGVAVIGTVNSELFPVVDKFEGAVEGVIRINSVTQITYRNRGTRIDTPYSISPEAHSAAKSALGYDSADVRKFQTSRF